MPGGVRDFIGRGGRAGSPQMGQPTGRRAAAANAKVAVKSTKLIHQQPGQQNTAARRQSAGSINQQQHPQQRRSGEDQGPEFDPYGTDAESLDTTTHQSSVLQVVDSQRVGGQQHAENDSEYYSNSENESGEEYEDDEGDNGHWTFQACVDHFHLDGLPKEQQVQFLRREGVIWEDGNSYPSTTSGPPEGFPDNWNPDQEIPSDDMQGERASSPSPARAPVKGQTVRQPTQQAYQHPLGAPEPKHAMPKRTTLFDQGASIRDQQRSNVNLTVRDGVSSHQTNAAPAPSSQPPAYSQANRELARPVNANSRAKPSTQAEPLPQRGARPPSGPSRAQPVVPVEPAAPVARPAPARHKEEPVPHELPEEVPIRNHGSGPIEDYDRPALFDMSYDNLKEEDFDTVPRGQTQLLSDNMLQKPLAERLEHVQKNLDANGQDKFFRSLSTHEWEEAGDWFLDQFSSIIRRMKEARQTKRKLARDFEDGVEKRYRHVAKRQQHVEDSLDSMKKQGEGLMPRTPRSSKSPRKA